MTYRRPMLWVTALLIAVALGVYWRSHRPPVAPPSAAVAPRARPSGPPPFSPASSAPAVTANPAAPAVPSPEVATAPADADTSVPGAPAADVERRQDAKIARGLADGEGGGVLVLATPPGSVAGALHLKPGDLITAVNGQALTSTDEFVRLYRAEGLPNQLTVQREGREIHVH